MTAAGFDEDRGLRLDGKRLPVQLDMPLSFEHEVDLRHLLVVVRARVLLDLHDMHRGERVARLGEGAFGPTAGAAHGIDILKIGDHVIRHIDAFLPSVERHVTFGFPGLDRVFVD